jgi:hypothetical protein
MGMAGEKGGEINPVIMAFTGLILAFTRLVIAYLQLLMTFRIYRNMIYSSLSSSFF